MEDLIGRLHAENVELAKKASNMQIIDACKEDSENKETIETEAGVLEGEQDMVETACSIEGAQAVSAIEASAIEDAQVWLRQIYVAWRVYKLLMSTKFLTWNARGMGNEATCMSLRKLILKTKPDIFCVQETRIEDLAYFVEMRIWTDNWQWIGLPS
ncbi:hypothetical protein IFM89_015496 [Coptis chinensis]|uniref:Endonuclease/exonuclease/phosphatase domain-containing protein n=1 Tax=Coptis chinensis TaxID=261450 RepID=A0A835GXN4_9MAGN|nr:hypothetical protein IFM89_015496 [Coptis chinensis]